MTKETNVVKMVSLHDILARPAEELAEIGKGTFTTRKLGIIPYSAPSANEMGAIQRKCMTLTTVKKQQQVELDQVRMQILMIIDAVHKDERSDFTFKSPELLAHLQEAEPGIVSAEHAVNFLLSVGEINAWATEMQLTMGMTEEQLEAEMNATKNS